MAVFKRGNIYWYAFMWDGQRIQQSTKYLAHHAPKLLREKNPSKEN
jgi:hypothetical protein